MNGALAGEAMRAEMVKAHARLADVLRGADGLPLPPTLRAQAEEAIERTRVLVEEWGDVMGRRERLQEVASALRQMMKLMEQLEPQLKAKVLQ